MKYSAFIIFLCGLASFDAPGASGPITGYICDTSSRAIRPMIGFPGSAYVGASLVSGIDAASVAPNGSSALVEQKGQSVMLVSLGGADPIPAAIGSAIGAVDFFAWAPDAGSAAVYSSKTGRAQILSQLKGSPIAGNPIALS